MGNDFIVTPAEALPLGELSLPCREETETYLLQTAVPDDTDCPEFFAGWTM